MIIEVDGNDGVGKTTYIKMLKELFPNDIFRDRGLLSKSTLHPDWDKDEKDRDYKKICPLDRDVCYILLDTYPEVSQERIIQRGDSIEQKYHTMDDLIEFRKRFQILATSNKQRKIPMYSTHLSIRDNIRKIANYISTFKRVNKLWK